ncbi:alanine/glycine:cation symporter family protein [Ewingella americana]|uniref:Sodium:alanine symporter family protein n=1 Tax=Ewingella americana TaxID=41202 RepID=A0A502GMD1_9GAMM|nr:sodium:alanine symporter family protein [Ewingella americana]TPG62033.1 sodium:alanine symporter family protein [Ewingella americana]
MTEMLDFFDNILWGSILIYLLLGTGIYLSLRTRFIQFRQFGHIFSISLLKTSPDPRGISTFQALCISLAARIGTGNLSGVALALTAGGPGAIFWMWLIALIGMVTSLFENTLAQVYKSRDINGRFRGGPADYMARGLGMRWMGVFFSLLLVLTFGLIFNALQANAIAQAATLAFNADPLYIVTGLLALTATIIFGGLKSFSRLSQWVVPLMVMAYLILAVWVILHNIERLPQVFVLVFKSAFGLQEVASGAIGYGVMQALTQGVQRGLFSNEAGMGSSPNAAALAAPVPSHPAAVGFSQMLGVFIDTIVICSATALIILTSGLLDAPGQKLEGIALLQGAISAATGSVGHLLVAAFVFIFAFSSITANYVYAENNLMFLHSGDRAKLFVFRLLVLGMVAFGCLAELPLVWKMADIAMALMTITNLTALLLLSGLALKVIKDYERQREMGKIPVFNPEHFPEIRQQLEPGVWGKKTYPSES